MDGLDFSKIKFLSDEEIEAKKAEELAEQKESRAIALDKLIPKGFADTDTKRFPKASVMEAKAWATTPTTCKLN